MSWRHAHIIVNAIVNNIGPAGLGEYEFDTHDIQATAFMFLDETFAVGNVGIWRAVAVAGACCGIATSCGIHGCWIPWMPQPHKECKIF